MQTSIHGSLPIFDASTFRVGIVVAEFNADLTSHLLTNAYTELDRYQVKKTHTTTVRVAGCIEIPLLLQTLAATKEYDCLLALGAVIRGDTPHFDYVCRLVADGVKEVMLCKQIPIGFGVLTLETKNQASVRLSTGATAMAAALHSAAAIKKING